MAVSRKDAKRGRGRPATLGDHRAFTLRLKTDVYLQLKHLAVDREVSLNDLVAGAIEEWWRGRPERAAYARRTVGAKRGP